MTRPIIWAAGSFVAIAFAATVAGDRMSRLTAAGSASRPGLAARTYAAPSGAAPAGAANQAALGGRTTVIDGDRQGHFLATTAVEGRHLVMMVDTGASIVALSHEDAAAVGIRPAPGDYRARMSTANGEVAGAPVRIREIRIGEIHVRDVEAVVMPRGLLRTSLLGMSFLRQLRGFDIAGNRLTLRG